MLDLVIEKLSDPRFLAGLLVAIGCAASVLTLAMPLLHTDNLGRRMKAVGSERERIRQRERERLVAGQQKTSLRYEPKRLFKQVVEQFNLSSWLGTDRAKHQLAMAGFRGVGAEYTFLFFRLVTPILFFVVSLVYLFFVLHWDKPPIMKVAVAIGAAYIGMKGPEIFLSNTIAKRKKSMERAYPNALDLMLICAESGMSIEMAVRKVAQEIGTESIPMAEELTLLAAEMSYLADRRTAYENFGLRTGLESIRALVTVLVQSERYGTPLGTALRVLAQESRDQRMTAAEKKAAALPPQLTVPMVLFFLPGLFVAIMTPAIIQINHWT
ncbi:MAG TPA: type II secretion system F family protein [Roseiarcus sp.]|jgi:tight adherence protein C|nr:type II secretion system F family protein [Roseiarcus sp.]